MSQQELARRARISQSRISQIESGNFIRPLPLRTLVDLADALGIDLEVLLADDPIYADVDLSEQADQVQPLAWCLALAERSAPNMFTADEPAWLNRLRREDKNLQAALGWAFGSGSESDLEQGTRLAGSLADYWYVSGGLSDGLKWLTRAIDLTANQKPSIGRARVLVGACQLEQTQGVIEPAQVHGEQGLIEAKLFDDQPTIGRALLLLGNLAMMRGDLYRAQSLHEAALVSFRRLDDRARTALALLNLGMDFYRWGGLRQAEAYAEDALAIASAIGDRWDTIATLRLLGDIARDRGDLQQASVIFAESLALGWQQGSDREVADCLSGLGTVSAASGDLERAARLFGAAETLYRRFDIEIPPPLRPDWVSVVSQIQAGLTDHQFRRSWASASAEMVTAESLALGWRHGIERQIPDSLSSLGSVEVAIGDFERAESTADYFSRVWASSSPERATPELRSPTSQLERHTRIECPEECQLQRPVQLLVQLTLVPEAATRVTSRVRISRDETTYLDIHITAPGFVIDLTHRRMTIPDATDSEQVTFQLVPTEVGDQVIEVEFIQHGSRIGYVLVTTFVKATEKQVAA